MKRIALFLTFLTVIGMYYFFREGVAFKIPLVENGIYNREVMEQQIKHALLDLQNLKDRSSGLDQMRHEMPGKHIVRHVFGTDEIMIIPKTHKPVEKQAAGSREVRYSFPVLAIRLVSPDDASYADPTPIEDCVATQTDPSGGWVFLSADDNAKAFGAYTYQRLDHVGQMDHQGHSTTVSDHYPQVPDNWLLAHEMAYRDLSNAFGTVWYNVDPVLFTCGDYEPVTTLDEGETYAPKHRAESFDTHTSYSVTVENVAVAGGTMIARRDYEFEYVEQYTIPESLEIDGWTEEYISRCCLPDGEYALYERSGLAGPVATGTQVYHQLGEGVVTYDAAGNVVAQPGDFGACLYAFYRYDGTAGINYYYELRLSVLDKVAGSVNEWVVYAGTRTTGGDMPDDLHVSDFKIFSFGGRPVIAFAYYHFFWTAQDYVRYGLWYNDQLYMTEAFPSFAGRAERHDVADAVEAHGLEGCGKVWAFGVSFTHTVPYTE